jgi:integrase
VRNPQVRPVSGHVFRVDRRSGPVWYAKYRLPDGRQVQKRIGPAWCQRGRPAPGFFTQRGRRRGWLRSCATRSPPALCAARSASARRREWLRDAAEDRACKPTTIRDYRNTVERRLMPFFGGVRLDAITPQMVETWRASLTSGARTKNKQLTILNGIIRRACRLYGLRTNPVSGVERLREPKNPELHVFEPEEVWALVRAARSEQYAAIFLTAAITGLRMGELRALRWRDVDFARLIVRVYSSYRNENLTTP